MFKKHQVLVVFLICVVLVLAIYNLNKANNYNIRETFKTQKKGKNYIDTMDYSNEILVKFCKKLRTLDKPNDFNILLKNMKDKSIDENRETIDGLIAEIQDLQKDISLHDTEARELYKLDTHNTAKKQVSAVNKAISNVKSKNNITVELV